MIIFPAKHTRQHTVSRTLRALGSGRQQGLLHDHQSAGIMDAVCLNVTAYNVAYFGGVCAGGRGQGKGEEAVQKRGETEERKAYL